MNYHSLNCLTSGNRQASKQNTCAQKLSVDYEYSFFSLGELRTGNISKHASPQNSGLCSSSAQVPQATNYCLWTTKNGVFAQNLTAEHSKFFGWTPFGLPLITLIGQL